MLNPQHAKASSWNPALLVNTEAFQVIDASDTAATALEIRFGNVLGQRLIFDTQSLRFQFSRSLAVAGDISATGSVAIRGTFTGSRLSLINTGTVTATGAFFVSQRAAATGAMIKNSTNGRPVLALDSQGIDATSTHLIFGYKGTFDTNLFRKAANALRTSGSFEAMGALSGSTFYGSGLGDCSNPTTSKIIYSLSTGKFSCATDQTGGVGSGMQQSDGDLRYVRKAGDTMTGALTINSRGAYTGAVLLKILGAMSGAFIHAEKNLTSSGTIVAKRDIITQSGGLRDAMAWVQNQGNLEKLRLGFNNGGMGGGATPGNISMGATGTTVFDTTTVNGSSKGFYGAVFDGRYVYLVPADNGSAFGQITRYDTNQSLTNPASYTVFDTTSVNANSKGFRGAVFDGRYVYFVPYDNGSPFGQVTRYDTTQSFTSASSYAVFDTTSVNANSKGFFGAIFDGRYVYFVPALNATNTPFGQITRYDTTQSFTSASSYAVFDTTSVNANSKGFRGAVFDGRYLYFVPFGVSGGVVGVVTRYDTTQSFLSATSYSVFDMTTMNSNSKGFVGGVFDGRYIYFVPNNNGAFFGQVTRYDTTQSFTSGSSYAVFDTTSVNANSKGFYGGVFDGRYVYYVPYNNGSAFGQVTRYDTTQPFNLASSYNVFDTTTVNSNSKGFGGAVFDGRYVYLVPRSNGAAFGQITRLTGWAGGTDATPGIERLARGANFFIGSGSNLVGIGTSSPGAKLSVSGAAVIGANLANDRKAKAQLDVIGTVSGANLTFMGATSSYILGSLGVGKTSPATQLEVAGTISGRLITQNGAGNNYFLGNVGIGTTGPKTKLDVQGTLSGKQLSIINDTTVSATGAMFVHQKATATGAMIKNSANGRPVLALDSYGVSATSPQLIFGYRGTFDTNLFRKAANALRTSGSFEVMGTLSGSTFYGSGLGDCSNPTTSKIIYNLSTGKFSCATDQTGGVGSGLAYSAAEGIFVNQGGDTMTGALTIQNGNTPTISATPMLNVRGSISGATLRAGNMTVSGAVVYSSGNTLKQTAKGASGQILVAQGTDAPAWKNPTGAMVWYIDGTAIVQSRQGAIVTMPFAMTPTSVNLRATGAPTGTGVLIDIRRDNVSIFQRKPEILKGYTYGGTGATFSIATLTGGSVISVDIVRIGSTFAGSGITIQLNGIRKY